MDLKEYQWVKQVGLDIEWFTPWYTLKEFLQTWEDTEDGHVKAQVCGKQILIHDQVLIYNNLLFLWRHCWFCEYNHPRRKIHLEKDCMTPRFCGKWVGEHCSYDGKISPNICNHIANQLSMRVLNLLQQLGFYYIRFNNKGTTC